MPDLALQNSDAQDCEAVLLLQSKLGISKVLATLLVNRSIRDSNEAFEFLNPDINKLIDPYLFNDMALTVDRIKAAIANDEKITVYGDYDVDGITASSILFKFLSGKQANVDVYLPDRHTEGYGINKNAIRKLSDNGTKLIITVDCGITSVEEVKSANLLGMDVIITDHHLSGDVLPDAYAIIATNNPYENYPNKNLAGVGLAAKLIQGFDGVGAVAEFVDLIAVGTVADMVPLIGENRILVSYGLRKISENTNVGIKALLKVSGIEKDKINCGNIAFGLAPRLNASGRIGLAMLGFKLLTATDYDKALEIAEELNRFNLERQQIEAGVVDEASIVVDREYNLSRDKVLVVTGNGWHKGVIGIAASRMVEKYNRPCLVISITDGIGSGSARSISGFDLHKSLNQFKDLFIKMGGHSMAAGFSISEVNISTLKASLLEYSYELISDSMLIPKTNFEYILSASEIEPCLIDDIESLEPFGMGNPTPVFKFDNLVIEEERLIGTEFQHKKFKFISDQRNFDGIGFGLGRYSNVFNTTLPIIFASVQSNTWMGVSRIQLVVKSVKNSIFGKINTDHLGKTFYAKFFDVFLETFRYNNYLGTSLESFALEKQKHFPRVDVADFLESLNGSFVGNIVLVNSLDGFDLLLKKIEELNLIDSVSFSFSEPEKLGMNSIVIAPLLSEMNLGHYNNIYMIEGEQGTFAGKLISNLSPDILARIKILNHSCEIFGFKDQLKVDRNFCSDVYRFLQAKRNVKQVWVDVNEFLSELNEIKTLSVNAFQIFLVLEIFSELKFAAFSRSKNCFKVSILDGAGKKQLTESNLYCFYQKWFEMLNLCH